MKVLLVNPPNPDPPPAYFGPPYGLSLLGGILERSGHAVLCRDYDRASRNRMLSDAGRVLGEEAPDLVGIACLSSSRGGAIVLAREVKRLRPSTAVVLGGPFATAEPELVLRRSGADFVVVGDGEETLAELLEALRAGRSVRRTAGLAYRASGGVRLSREREPFRDLDSLPHPAFHLFHAERELKRYRNPEAEALAGPISVAGRRCLAMHSALMVLGSRGCVYRCVFCPMSRSKGRPRAHSPGYLVGMLEQLAVRYRQRQFVIGDNYFTRDRDWASEVCDGMIKRGLGLDWICMTRADAVDRRLLDKMAQAGCREISYGIESGSPAIQKTMGKRLKLAAVPQAFESTRKAGISSVLMLMVGNPGESRESIRETAAFVRDIEPDRVLVHTTKVYPGTRLHDVASRQGVIPAGFYEGDDPQPPVYDGELSIEELRELKTMLPARSLYVSAEAGCNNGCCRLRRPGEYNGGLSLRTVLALGALRAERVVLGGGEPLLRRDMPAVLRSAAILGIHDLRFYTNARLLADKGRCGLLRAGDAVRSIVVPLYSPDAKAHDARCRVADALRQTRLGMLRWKRSGGGLQAWAFIDSGNVDRCAEWVSWLAAHGVDEAVFSYRGSPSGWGGIALGAVPRLARFASAAVKAVDAASRLGMKISVFGVPRCLLDPRVRQHELESLFDEVIEGSGEPVSTLRRRRSEKAMPKVCSDCRERTLCEGVWKDYLARYGEGEFHAL